MTTFTSVTNEAVILATILLIDNDDDRLEATARLLETAGYSVITGSSAIQADSLTRLYRPDLVLLDDGLPDDSSADVTRRIKLDPRLACVRVVLVTEKRTGQSAGTVGVPADGYLARPHCGSDFLGRIAAFLRLRTVQELPGESGKLDRMLFAATRNGFALYEIIRDQEGMPIDCCFLEVNPAFEILAGLPAAELVGRSMLEIMPDSADHWREAYGKVAQYGGTLQLEGYFGVRSRYYRVELFAPQSGQLASIFTDVTGHKEAQEALSASEELYRNIINAYDGVIYICSQDYRITYMNDELIKRNGGSAIGEYCFKALHDLDSICPWCVNERVFKGEVVKWEVQSPKDGRWYYAINGPIHNPDGSVSKQAMIHDITHLKLAEGELKFKSFTLDNLAEEIFWMNADCRIQYVNQAACATLGYSREELLSLSIAEIDPHFAKDASRLHWENLKRLGSLQFESEHQTKDGRVYPVEITARYLNHNGLEYSCSIVRDITERKKLEKALQQSEEQFRSLCDSAPIGIFRGDGKGNSMYSNPRWEEITGFSSSEGSGERWRSAIHPDDREELDRVMSEAAACGAVFSHEHRMVTPQGKTIWVRALVNPIKDQDGTIVGDVGTLDDITELHQARQELLKSQKLESIGVLAGGIAHDFNNILTAILGNIALARYQMQDPEKVARRLEEAENAAARAKDLTHQLLTFARGGEPVKKVVQVPDLLREAAAFALLGSHAGCAFDLADDLWPLEADEGQLVQVVHNLVLNAVQAMPEGGTITIRAHNVSSRQRSGGGVKISISDTGAGISEQHLDRIFDPYFTTKQQGNGLGLASCYSIIKKHGGTITAESLLGKGSTFHVVLPASGLQQVSQPRLGSALSLGKGRVLVMDDEEIVRSLAKAVLEQLGYTAECVADGSQAAAAYLRARDEGAPFSAVILDLTVPGAIGGREAVKMLLKIDPQVKAIVCSGYCTDPVMANYREYGFSSVLCKPYRPQDLSKVLQELLGECEAQGGCF